MSKAHVPQRYRAEVDNRVREHEKVTHRQDRKTKREGSTRRATGVSKLLGDVLRQTDPQQFAVVTSEESQQSAHPEVVGGHSSPPVYSTAYAEPFRPMMTVAQTRCLWNLAASIFLLSKIPARQLAVSGSRLTCPLTLSTATCLIRWMWTYPLSTCPMGGSCRRVKTTRLSPRSPALSRTTLS